MLLIPTLLCPKPWEGMSGSEATRFCTYCKKHVHNLEAMSVSERLALLSSPAASICSRYQVAIRRPAKGKEASYYAHLAKHGAGVALVGSVLLVLWEMNGQDEKEKYYRAATTSNRPTVEMQRAAYEQALTRTMGVLEHPNCGPSRIPLLQQDGPPASHVDLKLDPVDVAKLIEPAKLEFSAPSTRRH